MLRLLRPSRLHLGRRQLSNIYFSPPAHASYFDAVSEAPTIISTNPSTKVLLVNVDSTPSPVSKECENLIIPRFRLNATNTELTAEALDRWSTAMADVVGDCASSERLKLFYWSWRYATGTEENIKVSPLLWRAVGSLKNLETLDLAFGANEQDGWSGFTEGPAGMPGLRNLRLILDSAHGWDCAKLDEFLAKSSKLEDLALHFPTCCGPENVSLSTTFPNLKSLHLTTYLSSPSDPASPLSRDIFQRHPQLERVYLDCDYEFTLEPDDLPNLKNLGVTGKTVDSNPAFYTTPRPIERLYLQDVSEDSIQQMLTPIQESLRFLELQYTMIHSFRQHVEAGGFYEERLTPLIQDLQELSIVTSSANCSPEAEHLSEADLIAVLKATRQTNIKTITFRDWWRAGEDLSPSFLEDIEGACDGAVSQSLERIIWDVDGQPRVYTVHRDGRLRLVDEGVLSPDEDQYLHWHFFI